MKITQRLRKYADCYFKEHRHNILKKVGKFNKGRKNN